MALCDSHFRSPSRVLFSSKVTASFHLSGKFQYALRCLWLADCLLSAIMWLVLCRQWLSFSVYCPPLCDLFCVASGSHPAYNTLFTTYLWVNASCPLPVCYCTLLSACLRAASGSRPAYSTPFTTYLCVITSCSQSAYCILFTTCLSVAVGMS